MTSSMRVMSVWMSSRSKGVMKVLCSRSTHACVITSVSCSISLMRAARTRAFCPPCTSRCISRAPSTVSAA
jgi:hypothetical protein